MIKSNQILKQVLKLNNNYLNKSIPFITNYSYQNKSYYNFSNQLNIINYNNHININNNNNNNNYKRNYCTGLDGQNIFESNKGALSEIYSIDGYSDSGFSINKVLIPGSICIMPHQLFLWDIHQAQDITIESLAPLDIIEPKCEFLLIGTGNTSFKFSNEFLREIQTRYQMNLETMTTPHAIGTYNILAEEGRRVAAFILPTIPVPEFKDPYFVKKTEYQDKGLLEKNSNILDLSTDLVRKKQTLIKMKLEESNKESIKLIEKQILKIEKELGINNGNNGSSSSSSGSSSSSSSSSSDQNISSLKDNQYYVPTRNVEEGFINQNNNQNDQLNNDDKQSIKDKAIIWFVKKFGKFGDKSNK